MSNKCSSFILVDSKLKYKIFDNISQFKQESIIKSVSVPIQWCVYQTCGLS